ncbi:MAG: polysaccharide biosynthesis/export family protein [Terracidiphilus sp.]
MKPGRLLILALFSPSLFCYSQSKESAARPAQVAEPAPTALDSAAGTASNSYVIGPSDVLMITVWNQPALSGTLLVRPDGMITETLIGDVQASGMTPLQLASQIATKLKKYFTDPTVSVVISQIHSKVVYLLGEVEKRGPVEMTPGMTLLNAIASAGGLTDYANTKKIYILRGDAGKQGKIPVRYKDALKGDSECNLVLEPGDTIVVP